MPSTVHSAVSALVSPPGPCPLLCLLPSPTLPRAQAHIRHSPLSCPHCCSAESPQSGAVLQSTSRRAWASCSPLNTNPTAGGKRAVCSEDYFGEQYLSKHLITQEFNPCLMGTFSEHEKLLGDVLKQLCWSREMPQPQGQDALTSEGNSNPRPGHKGEHQPST